jgi:hypothetical protein
MSPIQLTPVHGLLGPNQTTPTKNSTQTKPKPFSQTGFKPRFVFKEQPQFGFGCGQILPHGAHNAKQWIYSYPQEII